MMGAEKTSVPAPALSLGTSTLKSQASASAPRLVITKQPQTLFKYRYGSEMNSSHGFLYSETYEQSKDKKNTPKTYPEVRLENYKSSSGKVIIRASLVQAKSNDGHPNILAPNGINEVEISDNIASFEKLCVQSIKTEELARQHPGLNRDQLKMLKKSINMDSVRIKFSAFCAETNSEICSPVYSNPIGKKNIQYALEIYKMSLFRCSAKGGKDCLMVTSQFAKANSKTDDIKVRFYTQTTDGQISWKVYANIEDVIKNYALSIMIPAYKDVNIKQKVSAYVQLVRPSDGAVSEPLNFEYAPHRLPKHKMTNSSNSTLTPPMTPGRANEPIMQGVAEQLRQESDERHGPGIHLLGQEIISDRRLDKIIDLTTNQSYGMQNPPQILTNQSYEMLNPPQILTNQSFGMQNPPQILTNQSYGMQNPPQILTNQSFGMQNPPQILTNQSYRMQNPPQILDEPPQNFVEPMNPLATGRDPYLSEAAGQRSPARQQFVEKFGQDSFEELPLHTQREDLASVPPANNDNASEQLNETWEILREFIEEQMPNYMGLWTESELGDNTQSNSSDGINNDSTPAAQVREVFSDGPAPKKKKYC